MVKGACVALERSEEVLMEDDIQGYSSLRRSAGSHSGKSRSTMQLKDVHYDGSPRFGNDLIIPIQSDQFKILDRPSMY
jgi:hypothetical protein